jgi:hypothetical protein
MWRMTRIPSYRSQGPINTRCHQLRCAAQNFIADVRVDLRQIY